MAQKISTRITPEGSLDLVSQHEVQMLMEKGKKGVYKLFRQCSLAVLNCGNESDDPSQLLSEFADFDVRLVQQTRGIKLEVENAPATAFVDGQMIKGIQEHLFAVLRDIVHTNTILRHQSVLDLSVGDGITNFIFHLLRNAGVLVPRRYPNIVVCWGGHSISREEYDFTKEVGHSLGLRGLDICTGCGPGAMKGPMKGAAIAHAKQRLGTGRYIGLTEPGIIAAESPNPIVNELVILPDIEKRLEAFVRLGHGIIVFPGGVGTAEEILYMLGVLSNPANKHLPFPLIFAGSRHNEEYFGQIDEFIGLTLGKEAQSRYQIIIDDPERTAIAMNEGMEKVTRYRKSTSDAYYFNWSLQVAPEFQQPFFPTHESMRALELHKEQPLHQLASSLRQAFSGIVSGNVKEEGVTQIAAKGPFEISGDKSLLKPFNALLTSFVKQGRMKLPGSTYVPSYKIV